MPAVLLQFDGATRALEGFLGFVRSVLVDGENIASLLGAREVGALGVEDEVLEELVGVLFSYDLTSLKKDNIRIS